MSNENNNDEQANEINGNVLENGGVDSNGNIINIDDIEEQNAKVSLQSHPYNSLTPDIVIDALESTGRFSDARILALNSYENRVYQIGIDQGEPVIAKFYRPNRWTDDQILEEHAFTRYLYERDIPVVPPLYDDGVSLFQFAGFRFSIYARQGGRAPELDNLEHLYQLGQFIGRIHQAGKDFTFKHRNTLQVQTFGVESVHYLLDNRFIPVDLLDPYQAIVSDILEVLARVDLCADFQQISLHGDCHPGNVLWRDDRPHFVDFDDAVTGPAIQDLWMLLSGDRVMQQQQFEEIVEGYEVFSQFDLKELALVEVLRALRVLHYNAWLARRWDDPAFPRSFPWFNTHRYWSEHILELKELLASLSEPPLRLSSFQ